MKTNLKSKNKYRIETIGERKTQFAIFPLNCLNIDIEFKLLIKYILLYHCVNVCRIRFLDEKYQTDKLDKELENLYERQGSILFEDDCLEAFTFIDYLKIVYKKMFCKNLSNTKELLKGYKLIKNNNKHFEIKYHKDAKISIGSKLLLDILNKNALKEPSFRILCAVYSKIGIDKYQIITNDEIRCRAFGYKSNDILLKEMKLTKSKLSLYSNKKLSIEIPQLICKVGRGFFSRYPDGRKYYYSKKFTTKQLSKVINTKRLRNKLKKLKEQREIKKLQKPYNKVLKRLLSNEDEKTEV